MYGGEWPRRQIGSQEGDGTSHGSTGWTLTSSLLRFAPTKLWSEIQTTLRAARDATWGKGI